MSYIKYFIVFFLFCFTAEAQVVNIEALRLRHDTTGFKGSADLTFYLNKNTSTILAFRPAMNMVYKTPKYTFWALANYNLVTPLDEENAAFERNGFFHLRYNYTLKKAIYTEIFGQYLDDYPLYIENRIQWGLGMRFDLLKEEIHKLSLGFSGMYELEKERDELAEIPFVEDYRLNTYLSYQIKNPDNRFTFTFSGYYQPLFNSISDYRLALQGRFEISLVKKLSFLTNFKLNYDSNPIANKGIPNNTYNLSSGFSYQF